MTGLPAACPGAGVTLFLLSRTAVAAGGDPFDPKMRPPKPSAVPDGVFTKSPHGLRPRQAGMELSTISLMAPATTDSASTTNGEQTWI